MIRFLIVFLIHCVVLCLYQSQLCHAYTIEKISSANSPAVLNLVFCPVRYSDRDLFHKDIDFLIAEMGKVAPFSEFSAEVGYFRADISADEEGSVFEAAEGRVPFFPRRQFVEDVYQKLHRNFKLIILDGAGGVSIAELSRPQETSTVIIPSVKFRGTKNFARYFLHELGHALGLRDEGVKSAAAWCPPGPPNCARTEAEARDWWGDLVSPRVSFYPGCAGSRQYFRPTVASLMNQPDKACDFGPVNERHLRKIFSP